MQAGEREQAWRGGYSERGSTVQDVVRMHSSIPHSALEPQHAAATHLRSLDASHDWHAHIHENYVKRLLLRLAAHGAGGLHSLHGAAQS